MIKFSLSIIIFTGVFAGTAYFYLPDVLPVVTQKVKQQKVTPQTERQMLAEKMPIDVALLGIGSIVAAGSIVLSNLDAMGKS